MEAVQICRSHTVCPDKVSAHFACCEAWDLTWHHIQTIFIWSWSWASQPFQELWGQGNRWGILLLIDALACIVEYDR